MRGNSGALLTRALIIEADGGSRGNPGTAGSGAVVIDEAVELAKRFSTDDSGRFVNGVLAAVAKTARPVL